MHNFIRSLSTVLLAATAVSAFASTGSSTPQRVEISAPRNGVNAAQAARALRDFDTTYDMSNGRSLTVTAYGNLLEMRYAKRSTKVLRHDGQGNFVSRDGSISLQFEVDGDGEARLVRLTAPASWL